MKALIRWLSGTVIGRASCKVGFIKDVEPTPT